MSDPNENLGFRMAALNLRAADEKITTD